MFYSQFILAKKGPLGTIWIAAHLERKLRKNQVADTDIGVSVDSILFPEAPIALRLSSHLLLGVVRIYSRKVNYLFDDCSEALLKVKQAFRSSAVDLAPEESTAPYHSITLPETFDLDDFELPENEIFQGNYVDHHVSAREQITLQDTMDGVVYSTSQFGLDERFGDGDTSQINLDLDEEVFQDKDAATGNGVLGSDENASVELSMALTKNATTGASYAMVVDDSENQIEDLAANAESNEYAQPPQTPGLVEVPNLSVAREELACDDQMEVEECNASESVDAEEFKNASSELGIHQKGKSTEDGSSELNHDAAIRITSDETGDPKKPSNHGGESSIMVMTENKSLVDGKTDVQNDQERVEHTRIDSPCCSYITSELEDPDRAPTLPEAYNDDNMADKSKAYAFDAAAHSLESPSRPTIVDAENLVCLDPKDIEAPTEMQGDQLHVTKVDQETDSTLCGEVQADGRRSDEQAQNLFSSDDQLANPTGSVGSDLPAPEKFLSVPELAEKENGFMVESTPEIEELAGAKGDAGTTNITGKKRTFTESTLTAESFNSVESVALIRSRRTAESIPDDDDLLSSILVGRSSFLKIKPSPVLEVASTKRLRSAPRSTASKRKVLMDDSMVLHGDVIRQQLISTEDIRRARKKAPCTRPEILMIHRQFLEDELFKEPILTGLSVELVSLHSEPYDLNEIRIVESDQYLGATKDAECSISRNDLEEERIKEPSTSMGFRNGIQEQPAETPIPQQDQLSEDCCNQGQTKDISHEDQVQPVQHEHQVEKSDMEGDTGTAFEANHSTAHGEICEIPTVEKNDIAEDILVDGSSGNHGGKRDGQVIEDASLVDTSNKSGVVSMEVVDGDVEKTVLNEMDMKAEDKVLQDETKFEASVEINDVEADRSVPCDNVKDSLTGSSLEVCSLKTSTCANGDEAVGEADNVGIHVVELKSDNKDPVCDGVCNEEDKICCVSLEPDDGENQTGEETGNVTVEHDTEFLNVDDDEVAEDEDDDGVPYGNETRLLENSGWSSRTRAVAKYLQTLFDKEAEHGKKVLPMDSLLVGKTRKEASRMFFETLVLKTKDYVHVEQTMPFEGVNIKPRAKLMKSVF